MGNGATVRCEDRSLRGNAAEPGTGNAAELGTGNAAEPGTGNAAEPGRSAGNERLF